MINSNLPKHIAIIPDGNRRWAKSNNLAPWKGHFEGAKRAEEVMKAADDMGIEYLTIWASSYDNLTKRSREETSALDKIYQESAEKLLRDKANQKGKKIRLLGEWNSLVGPKTAKLFREVEALTATSKDRNLTLLVGYNGDREMIDAIKTLISTGLPVTSENIKGCLWTRELPPVDLIIRTGGESHISAGFMMWDAQYAKLHFSNKNWPDFRKEDFLAVIDEYAQKIRRFGA